MAGPSGYRTLTLAITTSKVSRLHRPEARVLPDLVMNEAVVDSLRHEANAKLKPKEKGVLGQFMTPFKIAEFMSGLFTRKANAVLLDAGAGIGSLTLAASNTLKLKHCEAWEIDPVMANYLKENLDSQAVPYKLHQKDFVFDSVHRIQVGEGTRFTHAILNPPYRKIGTNSLHRQACRQVGVETTNLYTAFLALSILQMKQHGEIVAIIPRSFCNGPYYKPFRDMMLEKCSVDAIHVFGSRNHAFKDDDVLQENVILKLTAGGIQGDVSLSFSDDASFEGLHGRTVPFEDVVQPADEERFVRIPKDNESTETHHKYFTHSLKELGVEVRTGPVVDFRLKEWWSQYPGPGTAPCIYPHHMTPRGFEWPKEHKKPNAIFRSPEVDKWLMKEGNYVVVRRFSAKEERRRVMAYLITPEDTKSEMVGFENHWNVLHIKKGGLPLDVAKGLVVFLNSTALDEYFRVFSGHTQVNATDLRNMKFPSLELLRKLAKGYSLGLKQEELDALLTI
ncbi:Eco57I restriction-modification methylase domain-containing protein [Pandoraea sp. PE-S2T-3]|uniref:Eco57I restriction-modification methylase domain-containing protein n=1 Tax=Pandoraea sp. PE-S2T-3 TaxID=1986993 RepID=UPI001C3CEA2E|nr:Eco57I restriction-modification methylase domain-containing protein [Pandoraea sp. PE-S2T-3]